MAEKIVPYLVGGGAYALYQKFTNPKPSSQELSTLVQTWLDAVCSGDPNAVTALYASDAVLVGTVAQEIKQGTGGIHDYFVSFLSRPGLCGSITSMVPQSFSGMGIASGVYQFLWEGEVPEGIQARYSFVFEHRLGQWLIVNHHSSAWPK
jgi:hypothetical protein